MSGIVRRSNGGSCTDWKAWATPCPCNQQPSSPDAIYFQTRLNHSAECDVQALRGAAAGCPPEAIVLRTQGLGCGCRLQASSHGRKELIEYEGLGYGGIGQDPDSMGRGSL